MTRTRWILQALVAAVTIVIAVMIYIGSVNPHLVLLVFLGIILALFTEVVWRFAHPYIPDREGLIWKWLRPVEEVDSIINPIMQARNKIIAVLLVLMLITLGCWTGAYYVLATTEHTVVGIVLLTASCIVWSMKFVISTLLPRGDQ
jgi:hypothetical protein